MPRNPAASSSRAFWIEAADSNVTIDRGTSVAIRWTVGASNFAYRSQAAWPVSASAATTLTDTAKARNGRRRTACVISLCSGGL
jgi:hypothetical protein